MLTVCTFYWQKPGYRSQFSAEQVNVHYAMFARNYHQPFRYVCVTNFTEGLRPEIETHPLWDDYGDVPSPHSPQCPTCYRRLKLFHPETARAIGDRILWMDLDMVICGDVTPLFDRTEPLVLFVSRRLGLLPQHYNGSMLLMDAGCRPDLWEEFTPEAGIEAKKAGFFGSDQGYLSWKLRDERPPFWTYERDRIYTRRHLNHLTGAPPDDAAIVMFMGKPDPWERAAQRRWPWIKYHYAEVQSEELRLSLEADIAFHRRDNERRFRHLQINRPIRAEDIPNAY